MKNYFALLHELIAHAWRQRHPDSPDARNKRAFAYDSALPIRDAAVDEASRPAFNKDSECELIVGYFRAIWSQS
jgi:hypothetical protein